jgi:hypothetical protein
VKYSTEKEAKLWNQGDIFFKLYSIDHGMQKEIRRVIQAWRAFWSMKYILKDKSISRSLRLTTVNTCIYPVLLFGCQTWSPTESQKMSIDVCQRKTERKLLDITNRVTVSNGSGKPDSTSSLDKMEVGRPRREAATR